ncbi:MAG: STAS domain-containing protein [Chloroflexi bacterium]|nr:STAS domain-containing protein [Chloroflexota bacterium]MBU1747065.1 STAS domain-containing protein [Chloroflexota bacterium]MBU1878250.1 STAS domain-containing protein [Chloroflexota bacterium]
MSGRFALSPEEQATLAQAQSVLADQEGLLVSHLRGTLGAAPVARASEAGAEAAAFLRFLAELDPHAIADHGAQRASQEWGLPDGQAIRTALNRAAWQIMAERPDEYPALQGVLQAIDIYMAAFWAGLWHASLQIALARRESASRPASELASPVIQVWEGVLVLPLVGAIDSDRARHMTEDLLNGIKIHEAEQVIIDITGVPVVDTGVAHHLLQTIKAARLLGAHCLLVGIKSEVAQAIVHLGIDLSGVATQANLQAGIETVLAQMGLGVASLVQEQEPPSTLDLESHNPAGVMS